MNPRGLLAVFSTLVLGTHAGAQTAASPGSGPTAAPDSSLEAFIAGLPGEKLELGTAVSSALVHAAGARIAEAERTAAAQAVRREKGWFDPELFGTADWGRTDTPSVNPFAGADVLRVDRADFEAGARIRTRLGTELTASLNSLRATSNSDFAALSPEYQSYGALSLRQPLLKGFGPAARSDLAFAEHSFESASRRYESAVLTVRAEVETLFWQLYAAERNHSVTTLIRERAGAFLDDTRKRAGAGIVGPSAVANAEFFLTEAEQSVLDTEEQLDRISDRLASLMGRRPDGLRFRAADDPPGDFPHVDQSELVAVVMERNPNLTALAQETDGLRALEKGAAWDARPTLDLVGGLGGNGLSGRAQDVYFLDNPDPIRVDIDGGRGDAAEQALRRDHPTWNVGLVFTLPLGAREGRGERDRWRAEIVRAEQQMVAARRTLEEETRAQYRELERGQKRMAIATRGVEASIRQVEIGMLEYNNGRTTAFEVVRLTADLATAQQRYSDALVRTAHAAAVLRQLTGGWYPGTEEN